MTTTIPLPVTQAVNPCGIDHLSFSALSTFQACPLKFYFRYVLGLAEETIAASLVFGSAIHRAIQMHFELLLAGDIAPSLDILLDVFWETWNAHRGIENVRFNCGEDINTIGRLADRVLTTFRLSEVADPGGTIIGVEEPLSGVVVPGCPEMVGRVDLMVETEDALLVTDFKTSRREWCESQLAGSASQLLIYNELVQPLAMGKSVRLAFAVLTKTTRPSITLHPVLVDQDRIDRTKRIIDQVWRAIQAGYHFPNPSPINCSICPYRTPCQRWTG